MVFDTTNFLVTVIVTGGLVVVYCYFITFFNSYLGYYGNAVTRGRQDRLFIAVQLAPLLLLKYEVFCWFFFSHIATIYLFTFGPS